MKTILSIIAICFIAVMVAFSQSNPSVNSLSAKEFKKMLDTRKVLLIDVRSAEEFGTGHIVGAINVDVNNSDFLAVIKSMAVKKELALYCRSGRRSKMALSKVSSLKLCFYELNEGILSWKAAGYKTITNE